MEHFTKEEAVSLLGETVICKKAFVREFPGDGYAVSFFDEGEKADVIFVEKRPDAEGILVSMLIDEVYVSFNKAEFDRHCVLLNSTRETSYASVG